MKRFALVAAYHAHGLRSLDGKAICLDWSASSCLLSGLMFALNLVVKRSGRGCVLRVCSGGLTLAFLEIGILRIVIEVGFEWCEFEEGFVCYFRDGGVLLEIEKSQLLKIRWRRSFSSTLIGSVNHGLDPWRTRKQQV
jgi:hypothetical protein